MKKSNKKKRKTSKKKKNYKSNKTLNFVSELTVNYQRKLPPKKEILLINSKPKFSVFSDEFLNQRMETFLEVEENNSEFLGQVIAIGSKVDYLNAINSKGAVVTVKNGALLEIEKGRATRKIGEVSFEKANIGDVFIIQG